MSKKNKNTAELVNEFNHELSLARLYARIEVAVTIRCENCDKVDWTYIDPIDAPEIFYADGWEVINNEVCCRQCAKNKRDVV